MCARYTQTTFQSINDLDLVEQIMKHNIHFVLVNIEIFQSINYLIEYERILTE
jgi:hypothetical protein